MSGTITPPTTTTTTTEPQAHVTSWGTTLISFNSQFTFFLALALGGWLAYVKGEYTLLVALSGVAATNATTVVNYFCGSSEGSDKKTAIIAAMAPANNNNPPLQTRVTTTTGTLAP